MKAAVQTVKCEGPTTRANLSGGRFPSARQSDWLMVNKDTSLACALPGMEFPHSALRAWADSWSRVATSPRPYGVSGGSSDPAGSRVATSPRPYGVSGGSSDPAGSRVATSPHPYYYRLREKIKAFLLIKVFQLSK